MVRGASRREGGGVAGGTPTGQYPPPPSTCCSPCGLGCTADARPLRARPATRDRGERARSRAAAPCRACRVGRPKDSSYLSASEIDASGARGRATAPGRQAGSPGAGRGSLAELGAGRAGHGRRGPRAAGTSLDVSLHAPAFQEGFSTPSAAAGRSVAQPVASRRGSNNRGPHAATRRQEPYATLRGLGRLGSGHCWLSAAKHCGHLPPAATRA